MDLTAFRRRISAVLGLTNSTSGDQPRIDDEVNDGIVDFLTRTNAHVQSSTTVTTAGDDDYELDTDILKIVDLFITSSSSDWEMEQVSPSEILAMRRRGASVNSPATHYAIGGSNLLMLYPTPAGADEITFYYVPRPTAMTSGTNDPSSSTYGGIPSEFHRGIELFALSRMADQEDDKSSEQGERYRALYEEYIHKTVIPALNRKGGTRAPRARIGRRTTFPTRHNDRY